MDERACGEPETRNNVLVRIITTHSGTQACRGAQPFTITGITNVTLLSVATHTTVNKDYNCNLKYRVTNCLQHRIGKAARNHQAYTWQSF